ncbi:MAG: glycoside hydrolase family 3 N-terminal domain-containing protein, partial [Calditrichaceae bacterium]
MNRSSEKMKNTIYLVIFILTLYSLPDLYGQNSYKYDFQNPDLPTDARIKDILNRLTPEEKISQLTNDSRAIDRLGIPEYEWWNECLHGVARAGKATVFPQAIGMAATWNTDLIFKTADIISTEARAKHQEALRNGDRGRYKGLTFWSPNINIFRDPRWGRGQETYGEDPYLTSRIGVAFVEGIQGANPEYLKAAACAKHYAVHSGPEHLRHEFDVTVSERDLWETYFPAFRALVEEAHVEAVMCAYNSYDGEACCGSDFLLKDILRNQWDFNGHIVSDCGAVKDIYASHHIVDSEAEAAALALKSGTDVNCGWTYPHLQDALKKGLVTEADLDRALSRLLKTRFKLGMFDPPDMVPYAQIPYEVNNAPEHAAAAREVARQSMVLLKNENNILPLSNILKRIAVIGPNADSYDVLLGNYHGTPVTYSTALKGIRDAVSDTTEVLYALGVNYLGEKYKLKPIPADAFYYNGKEGLKVTYYDNNELQGEPFKTGRDNEINYEWSYGPPLKGMPVDNFSISWEGNIKADKSGRYYLGVTADEGLRLYFEGKLVLDSWEGKGTRTKVFEADLQKDILYTFKLEYYDRRNNAQVMFGWHKPGYVLQDEAINIARDADAVIFVGGISPQIEGEEMG